MAADTSPKSTPSREEIARIEMERTTVSPAIARRLVAVFVLLVGAPPAIDWIVSRRSDAVTATAWSQLAALPREARATITRQGGAGDEGGIVSRIVSANRAVLAGLHAFEDSLSDESPMATALRQPGQRMLSGWLGVGNERVYQGRDSWLFYRPDVDYVIGSGFLDPAKMRRRRESSREWIELPQPDPRQAIVGFNRQLESRGITLVVMPTPGKPAMHPEKLADAHEWVIPVQNPSYRAFIDDLRRENVIVFDLADRLARDANGAAMYLVTDTHWRPETMERAAEMLGAFIESQIALPPSPSAAGAVREPLHVEAREVSNVGDTAAMLDLTPGHRLNRPESVTIRRVLDSDGAPWQPSRSADVLVLGDSFSNIYSLASMGWGDAGGLVEHLGRVLERPIDRIVENDNGAYATRARLRQDIASGSDRLRGKRVVVLQFAARELVVGDWRLIELPRSGAQ